MKRQVSISRKVANIVLSMILACGLIPAPAFAGGGSSESVNSNQISAEETSGTEGAVQEESGNAKAFGETADSKTTNESTAESNEVIAQSPANNEQSVAEPTNSDETILSINSLLTTEELQEELLSAQKAEGTSATLTPGWTKSNTCEWQIDSAGKLTVRPLGGTGTGTLANWSSYYGAPWYFQSSIITSVVIEEGVAAQTCYGMFYNCSGLTSVDLTGLDTSSVTSMSLMFYNCSSLTSLDLTGLDASSVTDMSCMFDGCSNLTSVDLTGLDTSSVTSMSWMFYNCSSLTSLDLSGFDTSAVTYMNRMFYGCSNLTSVDLSGLDTSKVTDMNYMFCCCSSLTSADLTGLDTSKVTDMASMFNGCSKLVTLDLSSFDFGNVTSFEKNEYYHYFAPSSIPVTVKDAESYKILATKASMRNITVKGVEPTDSTWAVWNTIEWKVEEGTLTIRPANGATTGMLGYPSNYASGSYVYGKYVPWYAQINNIVNVVIKPGVTACDSVAYLFQNHKSLSSVDLSELDFSTVKDMSYMFYGCASLKEVPVGFEILTGVTATNCFYVSSSTEIRYTGVNTAITAYDWASDNRVLAPSADEGWSRFGGTQWQVKDEVLTIAPLPGETTGEMGSLGVYTGAPWYSVRKDITSVKVEGNIKAGASLGYAFDGMVNLVSVDLTSLDTSATTDMSYMFRGCTSLASINLSCLKTPSLQNTYMAFYNCTSLQTINLTGWDFSGVTDMRQMFASCSVLVSVPFGLTIPSSASATKLFFIDSNEAISISYGGNDESIKNYDWASDNRVLTDGCANEHAWDEGVITKNPTCTDSGEKTLTCTACGATLAGYYIAPIGHTWNEPSIVFADDGKSASATWMCSNDSSHIKKAECAITFAIAKPATCTEVGQTTYTATATLDDAPTGTAQKTIEDIPATGHNFKTYTSSGNATCEADGTETSTCVNGCGTTDTRVAQDSALGHAWGTPVIVFSEDGKLAYAIWTCKNDISHMEVATCDVTSSVAVATCENAEVTTYTATAKMEGMPEGSVTTTRATAPAKGHSFGEWKTITEATCDTAGVERRICANDPTHTEERAIEAIGHVYGAPVIEFAENGQSATATWTCTHNKAHTIVRDCTITSEVTKATACTEKGQTTYTATIDADVALGLTNGKSTKTVEDIAALNHNIVQDAEIPATCETPGKSAGTHCTRCDYVTGGEEVKALDHTWGEWEVVTNATCGSAGVEKRTCKNDATHTETREITQLAHTWLDPVILFSEDGKSATALWTCENNASHITVATCSVTFSLKAATCETAEITTYTAKTTLDGKEGSATTTRTTAAAKGHSFTNYVSDSNATCEEDGTKTATCDNECGTTDTQKDLGSAKDHAWSAWETVTKATCETPGVEKRTCKNDATHIETREITQLAHTWLEPVILFSEDGTSATALWTCENNASHITVATCSVTFSVKAATCETAEVTTYTATAKMEGMPEGSATTTRTTSPAKGHSFGEWKTVTEATCDIAGLERRTCANDATHIEERTIAAKGHAWGTPVIEFAADNASATATWTCANDETHKHTETCIVTKKTKAATCFEHGENIYVATASIAGEDAFVMESTAEEIPATGHNFNGGTCANCNTHLGDVNGNGVLNIVDAQIAYDIATHNMYSELEGYDAYRAASDITGENGTPDGYVDAQDAFRIQYVALRGWIE